jgi:hypothetical protein
MTGVSMPMASPAMIVASMPMASRGMTVVSMPNPGMTKGSDAH